VNDLSESVMLEASQDSLVTSARRQGRKRSVHLTLVLVSAAALSACGNLEADKNMSRDAYANLEACKADWGAAGDCEAVKPGTSGSTGHSYYGPRYYSRSGSSGSSTFSSAARPGSNAVGTVSGSASRGGFGGSGAHHSGGSSSSSHSAGG
jgi:hypothetical protein